RYVILGGGPCGLAAAWHLAKRGMKPLVLEGEPLLGGLCATHAKEGWRFDLGGHRFVSGSTELTRWLEALLGPDLLEQERRSVILHEGRSFRYPLEARDLLENLGLRENARALRGYARASLSRSLRRPPMERTFEGWVTARFGKPLYDTFFGPYTEKLWGIPPSAISADWAAERISLLHLGDALVRMLGVSRPEIRTYARRYLYPRLGMGQLYEAIGADVVRMGGEIRRGARVTRLEVDGERVVALWVGESGDQRIPVGELLSTISLPTLSRMLRPKKAALPLVEARDRLRFRSLVFLNLLLERSEFSENTWMYVASKGLKISRIQEPKRRSPDMAPRGRTSLMLEIPCTVGDDTWNASVEVLEPKMLAELRALGIHLDDVTGAFIVRVENGYPIYHLGYEDDRQRVLADVARFTNVRTAGRQGLFRYIFMDAAMEMGICAADSMIAGEAASATIDAIGRAKKSGVLETQALTA
ncbi:MAG: FAD-dependent oxidoreductase, partial [Polyangiaceae bacterium]